GKITESPPDGSGLAWHQVYASCLGIFVVSFFVFIFLKVIAFRGLQWLIFKGDLNLTEKGVLACRFLYRFWILEDFGRSFVGIKIFPKNCLRKAESPSPDFTEFPTGV
ncbi:hypothetical protein U1Q18_003124, partial [Sarracenia purpurea var. burkii]